MSDFEPLEVLSQSLTLPKPLLEGIPTVTRRTQLSTRAEKLQSQVLQSQVQSQIDRPEFGQKSQANGGLPYIGCPRKQRALSLVLKAALCTHMRHKSYSSCTAGYRL